MMYIYITYIYIYIILYRRADQAWSARPRNIISDLFPETDRPVVEYGNLTPVMEACGKECFWPQRQVVGLCVLASHILVDVRPTWNIPIINCCVITSKKCCILVMHMNSSSCNNFCRYNMCVRTQMSVQRFPHFVLWQFAVPGAESAAHGKLHHQGIVKMIWESKLNIPNKNSAKLCHLLIRSCYTVLYRWLLLITSIIIYIYIYCSYHYYCHYHCTYQFHIITTARSVAHSQEVVQLIDTIGVCHGLMLVGPTGGHAGGGRGAPWLMGGDHPEIWG